jgi:outer membrane murein-binding lipoprotein Lpp
MRAVASGIDRENMMKLTRVWMGFVLGGILLAGCAGRAPVAELAPAPDHAALTARLVDLDARLDALERAVAAEREERRARAAVSEQALAVVKRELKAARTAVAGLRRKVEAPPAPPAPEARRDVATVGRDAPSVADYWPVDVVLGELPGGNGERAARSIPATIPPAAREILVYAQVATGYVKGGPHRFRIATRLDGGREAAFYLYAVGQPQPGWAYNSDNFWLPMPKNRELILQAEGEPFFGDWNSEVRIIGYR